MKWDDKAYDELWKILEGYQSFPAPCDWTTLGAEYGVSGTTLRRRAVDYRKRTGRRWPWERNRTGEATLLAILDRIARIEDLLGDRLRRHAESVRPAPGQLWVSRVRADDEAGRRVLEVVSVENDQRVRLREVGGPDCYVLPADVLNEEFRIVTHHT